MASPNPNIPRGGRTLDNSRPSASGTLAPPDGREYRVQDDTVFFVNASGTYDQAPDGPCIDAIAAAEGLNADDLRANVAPAAPAAGGQAGPGNGPATTPVAKSRSSVKDLLIATYVGAAGANLAWRTGWTTLGGIKDASLNVLRPFGSSISTLGSSIAKRTTHGFSKGWDVVDWKERGTERESRLGRAAQRVWDAGSNVSRFGLRTATAAVVGTAFVLGGTVEGAVRGTGRFALDATGIQYSPEGKGAETRAAVKPAEIADACRSKLGGEKVQEIAGAGKTDDAIGLAMTALAEAGVNDPEAFLREKGVLSSGPVSFGQRWSLAEDRGLTGLGLTVGRRTKEGLWTNTKGAAVAPAKWAFGLVGKEGKEPSLSDLQQAAAAFKEGAEPYSEALDKVRAEKPNSHVWNYARAAMRMSEKEFQAAALALMEVTGHKDGFWASVPALASAASYVMYGKQKKEDELIEKMKPEYGNLLGRLSEMSDAVLAAFVEKFDGGKLLEAYSLMGGVGDPNNETSSSVVTGFIGQGADVKKALRPNLQKELRSFFGFSGQTNPTVIAPKKTELDGVMAKLSTLAGPSANRSATQQKAELLRKMLNQMKLAANDAALAEIFPATV